MNLVFSILKMSRILNCSITFLTIVAASFICGGSLNNIWEILIGAAAGFFVAAAGNIINDYYDLGSDKINRPDRVLPSGKISPASAYLFYLLFNTVALITASLLGIKLFLIAAAAIVLLYLYSRKLKGIPLVGNIVVAFLTGLAFLFGSVIVGNLYTGIIPALFAFMINLMRELIKDVEDIEGDKAAGLSTYPIKYGVVSSIRLISVTGVVLIILTTIPFLFEIYNLKYFIFVMLIVNGILVFVISRLQISPVKVNLKLASNLLKLDMVLGIIAIILGSRF